MNIATQGGKIIVKDGKLAENCGCCGGWYCPQGTCVDTSSGTCVDSVACDCVGAGKTYGGDWSLKKGGCAPCAFLFPYNVTATATYTGPNALPGQPDWASTIRNGQRTYSPWTCNGGTFIDMSQMGLTPALWTPVGAAYWWGNVSFNYESVGDGTHRQVIWFIDWGIKLSSAYTLFHYRHQHVCSDNEASWDWIKGLTITFSEVYNGSAQLLQGGSMTFTVDSFDTLKVGPHSETGNWVRRCQ